MYILEIDNHNYNIELHSFFSDIKDIHKYNLEQSELIMMQHDIGANHEFEIRELGHFWISVKISYPHFFNLIIKYILTFASTYVKEPSQIFQFEK